MQNIKIDEDINFKVLDTTSLDMMSTIYCEELAELIQVVSKIKRYGINYERKSNLTEEIADVLICIQQMKKAYDIPDESINRWVQYKQERAVEKNYQLATKEVTDDK